jgi:NADH-quinone oxidoreductase subunit G
MEGATDPPPALIPFFWSPGWNSIQSVNRFQDEIAGVLKGGVPGERLIEPAGTANERGEIPPAFSRRTDEWLVVPLYHIFGSDPLSMQSPATASLAPKPYVALNRDDAARLGVQEGQEVAISTYRLPVRIFPELPAGTAGLPVGLTPVIASEPAWIRITP